MSSPPLVRRPDTFPWSGFRAYFLVPWGAALACGLPAALLPAGWVAAAAPAFFLGSAFWLGLPHGAADPWIPQWCRRRPFAVREWAAFLGVYLAVVGLVMAAWALNQPAAALAFLALTVWHWGSADAAGLPLARPGAGWAAVSLGRGLVVIAGSLALRPDGSHGVVAGLAGPGALGVVDAAGRWAPPLLLAGLWLEIIPLCLTALEPLRVGQRRSGVEGRWFLAHLVETGLLLLAFWRLPSVLAVGIYFTFFHSWRHLLRLTQLPEGRPGAARVGAFYRRVWPFVVPCLALMPLLVRWAPTGGRWLTGYLILLSALTLPHAGLVFFWLDRGRATRGR